MSYTIRMPQDSSSDSWKTDELFFVSPSKSSRIGLDPRMTPNSPPYYGTCFLALQNQIDRAYIMSLNSSVSLPSITLNAFPYPRILEDIFIMFAIEVFPLLFVLCMILAIKNIIKVSHQNRYFINISQLYYCIQLQAKHCYYSSAIKYINTYFIFRMSLLSEKQC